MHVYNVYVYIYIDMYLHVFMYIYTRIYTNMHIHKRIGILLHSSQDTVHLRPSHCCYHSRVGRVEIYVETATSFTDLLIEDVSRKKQSQ